MSDDLRNANRKLVTKLVLVVLGMFGFGFALVPIYQVFCDITGINGKTKGRYLDDVSKVQADQTREIEVQFLSQTGPDMPWAFRPVLESIKVHPGQMVRVDFYARNPTDQTMVAQAVPSLSPSSGVPYFHKTECFCFRQQTLQAGEEVLMPLVFMVDLQVPPEINTLTLAYTLYDQPLAAKTVADVN